MHRYLSLYLIFLRLGAFTFGGGLALLPFLQQEVTERHIWLNEEEVIDLYALAQCAPGIIAVNTAVYVGYRIGRLGGVLAAVLGLITSPMCLMTLVTALFRHLTESAVFQHMLAGIGAMVCALLSNTVWTMAKKSIRDALTLGICAAVCIARWFFSVSIVVLILGAGGVAIAAYAVGKWRT